MIFQLSLRSKSALFIAASLLLGGCGDGSDSDTEEVVDVLPDGLMLAFIDAGSAAYRGYNTTLEISADLNELAAASGDSSIQELALTDTADIGHILPFADFRMSGDDEITDMKYILMKPVYTYQSGETVSSDHFVQIVHLHDEDLAAHGADEYESPEVGSVEEAELLRLNEMVSTQAELETELSEALEVEGQTLCRAFIDPYLAFEHEHEEEHEGEEHEGEEHEGEEHEHEHGELVHYALTDSGRIYFYEEHEEELESTQPFVVLDDVVSITDCGRTTMARVNDEGILIFVPDSQMLYLVDAHDGSDFHQHSTWAISDLLPAGFRADLMAVIGEGEDHDHEDDDHDHEDDDHDHDDETA